MHASASKPPRPARESQPPGRPKDPEKRAAILEAAKRLFVAHGFDGASMDQVASAAGVSKLTVYSHFGDKENLFAAAAQAYCEQQLPASMFEPAPEIPLRERLLDIARVFHAMVMAPEALAGHRILCSPRMVESPVSRVFWSSGPERVQAAMAALLHKRIARGELEIDDVPRAASQFFVLLKGDPHARAVFGCGGDCADEAHVEASVDTFLRAYAKR